MLAGLARKATLYFRTIGNLKPVQLYGRAWAPVARWAPVNAPIHVSVRPGWRRLKSPFLAPHVATDGRTFTFLSHSVTFPGPIDWASRDQSMLWRYNLHYFEYLSSQPPVEAKAMMEDWIDRNADPRQVGWNPYPLSLRIVNWCKWLANQGTEAASDRILRSLYSQAAYQYWNIEHHIQANHLFENAKALFWAGLLFSGPEPERWLKAGKHLLMRELREQILPDGGHYELSPMYHSLILEACLDFLNMEALLSDVAPDLLATVREIAPRMTSWLQAMCHPDGEIALFNDAAFGIAPSPGSLVGYAADLLGTLPSIPAQRHLEASGYAAVRLPGEGNYLVVDVGRMGPTYQPGHSHCDTLSFELSLAGQRVIVDSGVFAYQDPVMRRLNRETAAHNTVRVDGLEQSEIWGGFRLARRAEPCGVAMDLGEEAGCIQGAHTGYNRVGVQHCRRFEWAADRLTIRDRLEGTSEHLIEQFFHFPPDVSLRLEDHKAAVWRDERQVAEFEFPSGATIQQEEAWYCPRFGQKHRAPQLVVSTRVRLPAEVTCQIRWI